MSSHYSPLPFSHFKANLPPNATTAELVNFLSAYFKVIVPGWTMPNLIATTILLGFLVIAALSVFAIKVRTKTFWFFRLQPTDSGNLVVVSPTTSFVIIEGLYAGGLLICLWCMVARSNGTIPSTNLGFAPLILGIPLVVGSWNGIWGLFLSCPLGIRGGGSIRASVLNFFYFSIPAVFSIITLVLSLLVGFTQRSATHRFEEFQAEMSKQDPNSMPTTDQINQAAKVFQDGAYAWHRMAQGYTFFFVFALLITFGLAAVGFYLRKILQHHLRYNAEFLANDENAIEAKIWENSSYYFPRVQMPEDAHSTPLRGRTRRLVLHSALNLVQSMTLCIILSASMFSAITGYFAFALYPKAAEGPKGVGHVIGILIVFFSWVTVAAAFPCYWLITSDLFEPALLGWQSRRAAGTSLNIKSPAFNDSVPHFKDPDQIYNRKQGLSGSDDRSEIEDQPSTEGYTLKHLSCPSGDGRDRHLSLNSRKAESIFSDPETITANVSVNKTFEQSPHHNPFKQSSNRKKRNTIVAESDGEEDERERERGAWRQAESRTSR